MMYVGDKTIEKLYLGVKEVDRIFLGTALVYGTTPPIIAGDFIYYDYNPTDGFLNENGIRKVNDKGLNRYIFEGVFNGSV